MSFEHSHVVDIGRPTDLIECCPALSTVPGSERLVLAAGEGHLTLVAAYPEGGTGSLREVDGLQGRFQHEGAVHAIAWAHASPSAPRFASVGAGRVGLHDLQQGGGSSVSLLLPTQERVNSCCFLAGRVDRLATTGDDGFCHIMKLPVRVGPAS